MQPFITFQETNKDGYLEYFVVQKDFPHYVGKITPLPKKELVDAIPFPHYELYMVFNYTLRGRMIPGYKNIETEIKGVMANMINWYIENRINKSPEKYKKFKL